MTLENLVANINSINKSTSFQVIECELVTNGRRGLLFMLPRIFVVLCSVLQ